MTALAALTAAELCDFGFLMERLRGRTDDAGLLAAAQAPSAREAAEQSAAIAPWRAFLQEAASALAAADAEWSGDRILLQLALEQPEDSPVGAAARAWRRQTPWAPSVMTCHRGEARAGASSPSSSPSSSSPDPALVTVLSAPGVEEVLWLPGGLLVVRDARALSAYEPWGGQLVSRCEHESWREERPVPFCYAVLRAGRLLAIARPEGSLSLWEPATGAHRQVALSAGRPILALAIWRDRLLLGWDDEGVLWRSDPGTGASTRLGSWLEPPREDLAHELMVVGDHVIEVREGKVMVASLREDLRPRPLETGPGEVRGVDALPDGEIVLMREGGVLERWTIDPPARTALFEGHTAEVRGVSVQVDGRLLSWDEDGGVRLWSSSGQLERALQVSPWISTVEVAADGYVLVCADKAKPPWRESGFLIELWDPSGACVRRWHHAYYPNCSSFLALLGDGRFATASMEDRGVRVGDPTQPGLGLHLGHRGGVHGGQVSPDDTLLATWSGDGTVRMWRCAELGKGSSRTHWQWELGYVHPIDPDRHLQIAQHVHVDRGTYRLRAAAGALGAGADGAVQIEGWQVEAPESDELRINRDAVAETSLTVWGAGADAARTYALEDGAPLRRPGGRTAVRPGDRRLAFTEGVIWEVESGAEVARLPGDLASYSMACWFGESGLLLGRRVEERNELVRCDLAGALHPFEGLTPAELDDGVRSIFSLGEALVAVVFQSGALLVLEARATAPRLRCEGIEGGLRARGGRLACWTAGGEVRFSDEAVRRIERVVPARGDAAAYEWAQYIATGAGLAEVDALGLPPRYLSATCELELGEGQENFAVSPDEALIAISARCVVEVRRIPSLELVARWVGEALRVRSIDEHARVLAYSFAEADGGEGGFVVLER